LSDRPFNSSSPRVLLVTEGFGPNLFGVARVVRDLLVMVRSNRLSGLVAALVTRDVLHTDREFVVSMPYWNWTRTLRFHVGQLPSMRELLASFRPSVVHVHGVLSPFLALTVHCAARRNIPTILSVHGMLEPWLWRQSGVFYYGMKRLYWRLVMRPSLSQVTCLHAITQQEADTLAREFPGIPQVLIPNAIHMDEYSDQQSVPVQERTLLFVGRLHPKKGVDLLIRSMAATHSLAYRLQFVGSGKPDYTDYLKSLVNELGLADRVTFLGGVFGEEKTRLMRDAWAVVVPSYSDVVALVNLEAAACFTPTITTTMTGLTDWSESGGLLVNPEQSELTAALDQVLAWSLADRLERGRRSREFVNSRYSWDVVGKLWLGTYRKYSA
jgi:glycosyltransferase involved in cell wall biosynthesis